MQNSKVKLAAKFYSLKEYKKALDLYFDLAGEINPMSFGANILLCLDKLSVGDQKIKMDPPNLAARQKLEGLRELFTSRVVVSLTSYPARIAAVVDTIKSILAQSFRPWKLVLWLADTQFPGKEDDLPSELIRLKEEGLSIEWCEDIRSYKKLIPSLMAYPDKVIVTADDDIIYGKDWLKQLIICHIQDQSAIVCHRAHAVILDADGNFSPYRTWPKEVKGWNKSAAYLFTGCGGVLYPPGSLAKSVIDREVFTNICPDGDDLWFWSMAILNGTKVCVVKDTSFRIEFIPDTQTTALWHGNVRKGGNDVMLRELHARYPELQKIVKKAIVNEEPEVSIIIPVFNTGQYLADCLDSVVHQSLWNFEVLCIDDGSDDELTKDILKKYSEKDQRIRVIRRRNSGPASSRNAGLLKARGTYIAFVDSDDFISESYLESLYECARKSGADIVAANKILCVDGDNQSIEKKSGFELFGEIDPKQLAAHVILTTGVSWNKLYKRNFLLHNDVKYLDSARCQSEDNYFTIKALISGYKRIAIAENATYHYRQHAMGITKNITDESFRDSISIYKEVISWIGKSDKSDKRYWVNVVNQRALRDLRYSARSLRNIDGIEDLLACEFYSEIDICCIADDKYLHPTMVFLESIKRAKRKTTFPSVTVLVPKGSGSVLASLEGLSSSDFRVEVVEIDSAKFNNLHKYNEKDNYCMASPSAMFKFIIPNIFPHLDRILYLDSDLIVRKDLLDLFMFGMDDEYLCAVPDLWNSVTDREDIRKFDSYFNSGVMLMNLIRMRENNIPDRLIEEKINTTNFDLMDQDIFNEVCGGRTRNIDIKFNFLPVCYKRHKHRFRIDVLNRIYNSSYIGIDDIAADPVVAHWAGSDKPWVSTETLFADEWINIFKSLMDKDNICGKFVLTQ